MSCADFDLLLYYIITIRQRNRQMDGRKDGRHSRSINFRFETGPLTVLTRYALHAIHIALITVMPL